MAIIDDLSGFIEEELKNYTEAVDDAIQKEIEKTAKRIRDDLSNNSNIPTRTGEYKKGFKVKKIAQGAGYSRFKIYNKKYQITHLLEKSHATRNGGRTKAYPHWEQAQKTANELFENIKKVIK